MRCVYVLMSEINGYKNIHNVYKTRENAMKAKYDLESKWNFERHYFYVFEMPIL